MTLLSVVWIWLQEASFLEIYCERLRDLLTNAPPTQAALETEYEIVRLL